MTEETSKLGWAWKEQQVNKYKHERRNKKIMMRTRGETRKLGLWEEKQKNKVNHESRNK